MATMVNQTQMLVRVRSWLGTEACVRRHMLELIVALSLQAFEAQASRTLKGIVEDIEQCKSSSPAEVHCMHQ